MISKRHILKLCKGLHRIQQMSEKFVNKLNRRPKYHKMLLLSKKLLIVNNYEKFEKFFKRPTDVSASFKKRTIAATFLAGLDVLCLLTKNRIFYFSVLRSRKCMNCLLLLINFDVSRFEELETPYKNIIIK